MSERPTSSDVTRRTLLGAGLGAAALSVAGCSRIAYRLDGDRLPETLELPENPRPAVRLAQRIGFGHTPGQLAEIDRLGAQTWIDRQLSPGKEEPTILTYHLMRLDVLRIDARELRDIAPQRLIPQLQQAAILRATLSPWQLRERMVDFWTNHFNVFAGKGLASHRIGLTTERVIRPNALGSFPAMLLGIARSPAMLAYLDNFLNTKRGPNENYARELMELHTLGVNSGYTQRDVVEVARCFTGWTLGRKMIGWDRFEFRPDLHDDGEKTVLGHRIVPGLGVKAGEKVLDILCADPRTARFIASKLGHHFLGTREGPEIDAAAAAFIESKGDVAATLRPILHSPRLLEGPPLAKRPVDYLVSCLRATAAETDAETPLHRHLDAMGQPLHEWPMPDGFPDRTSAWTGSLLARWNFAHALTHGQINGTRVDLGKLLHRNRAQSLAELLTAGPLHLAAATAASLKPERLAALALASPEFMWR